MDTISFYTTKDQYGYMSNFSRHPLTLMERDWMTSEHFYQAQKFEKNGKDFKDVASAMSPKEAAAIGRSRPLRPDWEMIKDDVMRIAVLSKFLQNTDIKDKLVMTHPSILVEHTFNDSYWADGGDGSGKNQLGKILMEVRETLLLSEEAVVAYYQQHPKWMG